MQRLTGKIMDSKAHCRAEMLRQKRGAGSIDLITNERVAKMCQMHPNLVGPTGFEATLNKRASGTGQRLQTFNMRDRPLAIPAADTLAQRIAPIPSDHAFDAECTGRWRDGHTAH